MKSDIIYSCPFVPAEWIEACGLTPVRITGSRSNHAPHTPPGVCPYAHAFSTEAAASDTAAAIVLTTVCDQMRRAADVIARDSDLPLFLMNVPHTWQTASSRKLYIEEIERLATFLERIGGTRPVSTDLAGIMLRYDSARADLRSSNAKSRAASSGIPIALIGGPLPPSSHGIVDMIEQAGGYVALDGTETGERTLPAPFDRVQLRDDPLATLADAYFGSIPDPFRRPNDEFFDWLKRSLSERGIRAIVMRRYVWCDNWHAEAQRIKDSLGLPFLHLDVGDEGDESARTLTRLQSLMEMLR